uniref:Uncharacterized protein n=1 Tax=Peronospora matthiolae TaxID=2874970 RepID=A0AAV1VEG6_9STRA
MNYPDGRFCRAPWLAAYIVLVVSVLLNLLSTAYFSSVDLCDMYPHFSFPEVFVEEIAMHQTLLPLVRVHVSTLHLLGASVVAVVALQWQVLSRGWLLFIEFVSGPWLFYPLFETVFALLPFTAPEPDVPELVSEDEGSGGIDEDGEDEIVGEISPCPVDVEACNKAVAKLVQVKLQYANQTILRPDDWLVFDPVQEKLVLQKHATSVKDAPSSSTYSTSKHSYSNGSQVDRAREQACWRQ